MDLDNMDDERLKRIVREEMDRREYEKQQLCSHAESGSLRGNVLYCNNCNKALDDDDLENAYTYTKKPS